MKINKKIAIVSVAALMGVSPVMGQFGIQVPTVNAAMKRQTKTVRFSHNSYIYNRKGKRLSYFRGKRAYLRKNSKLKVSLATSTTKTKYFIYGKNAKKTWLKAYTIKGKQYFGIGHGGYININNINRVNNESIYTSNPVKVLITKDVRTVQADGSKNNQVLKKGTVIKADSYGPIAGGEMVDSGQPAYYYHLAGSKDAYVIDNNTRLKSHFQNGINLYETAKAQTYDKVEVAYPNYLTQYDRDKIVKLANQKLNTRSVKFANHNRELVLLKYGERGSDLVSAQKLNINDYIDAKVPKIKNKKGYDSSATNEAIQTDPTLAKYAAMLDYNMRKSALVAKHNTVVYENDGQVGEGSEFNVNKLNLKKTSRTIKKGNNIGYYATLVVKIKGQYYFMIQEKSTYFVKADDVKLDNFSSSTTYQKYQAMIDKLMGPDQLEDFGVSVQAAKDTPIYNTDRFFEISKSNRILKEGKYDYFVDPYVVKYDGEYYFTGGEEFNSDFDPQGAIRCDAVSQIVKGQKF